MRLISKTLILAFSLEGEGTGMGEIPEERRARNAHVQGKRC